MSYILDALRKSESERHQGQVPHLGANPMLIHAGQRQQPLWPYILTGALLLNAAVVGVWLYSNHGEPLSSESSVPVVQEPVANVQEQPAEPVMAPPVAAQGAAAQPATGPVQNVLTAPPTPVVSVPQTQIHTTAAVPGTSPVTIGPEEGELIRPRQSQPYVQPPVSGVGTPGVDYSSHGGEGAVMITPETARQALAYDPYVGYMDDTAPGASHYRQLPGYQEPLSRLPADTPAVQVPYLEEMPEHFRRRVPTMRFNSHIYVSEPSARRIMVNNIYLRQGQTFAGMTVQEITENGAIFALDGVLFSVDASKEWINR